jgi:transcriptional regulator with XRE-family HTH domain
MNVGRRIREAREDLGMPVAVLARRIEVAPNTVWRYESGEREPSMTMLAKIARELRTEPADLLREPVVELTHPLADAPEQGQPDEYPAHYEDSIIALYSAVEQAAKREEEHAKSTPGVLPVGNRYEGPFHVSLLHLLAGQLYEQLTKTTPGSEELEGAKMAAKEANLRLGQILEQIIKPGSREKYEQLEHFRRRREASADSESARNQGTSRGAEYEEA